MVYKGISTAFTWRHKILDLGNYLSWHVLLDSSHRNRNEFFTQLWGQLLCARITRYGYDISDRPFLPNVVCME